MNLTNYGNDGDDFFHTHTLVCKWEPRSMKHEFHSLVSVWGGHKDIFVQYFCLGTLTQAIKMRGDFWCLFVHVCDSLALSGVNTYLFNFFPTFWLTLCLNLFYPKKKKKKEANNCKNFFIFLCNIFCTIHTQSLIYFNMRNILFVSNL